jgi:SAM-dependent methyltransferase
MTIPSPPMILLSALVGYRNVAEARAFLSARSHPAAAAALALLETHAAGAETAVAVLGAIGDGDSLPSLPPEQWAVRYDRAVAINPEASVALYSLADPALLAAVTDEMVSLLERFDLVRPEAELLEIGCGIGRFAAALGPRVRHYLGIDVSYGMVEAARRRCAGLANVEIRHVGGRDLAEFSAARFDAVLAIDVFPHLVASEPGLAARHIAEAARVLKPGGARLIMNYSYCGNPGRDGADVAAHAAAYGFDLLRTGTRDTEIWDGTTFLMRRAA